MQVDVTVKKVNGTGNLKAFCDVTFDKTVTLKGFSVVQGPTGLFCSVPRQKSAKDDKYYDNVWFDDKTFGEKVKQAVLDAYNGKGTSTGSNPNEGKNTTLPNMTGKKSAPKPPVEDDDPF